MKALEKARLALRKHLENLSEEDKEALLLELDANRERPKQVKENELLHDVSGLFPPLNTVRQEIDNYKATTMQGNKGHFQNGINWAFNYIAKKLNK